MWSSVTSVMVIIAVILSGLYFDHIERVVSCGWNPEYSGESLHPTV